MYQGTVCFNSVIYGIETGFSSWVYAMCTSVLLGDVWSNMQPAAIPNINSHTDDLSYCFFFPTYSEDSIWLIKVINQSSWDLEEEQIWFPLAASKAKSVLMYLSLEWFVLKCCLAQHLKLSLHQEVFFDGKEMAFAFDFVSFHSDNSQVFQASVLRTRRNSTTVMNRQSLVRKLLGLPQKCGKQE